MQLLCMGPSIKIQQIILQAAYSPDMPLAAVFRSIKYTIQARFDSIESLKENSNVLTPIPRWMRKTFSRLDLALA